MSLGGTHMHVSVCLCLHSLFLFLCLSIKNYRPSLLQTPSYSCFFCSLPGELALSPTPSVHKQMPCKVAPSWKSKQGLQLMSFSIIRKSSRSKYQAQEEKNRQVSVTEFIIPLCDPYFLIAIFFHCTKWHREPNYCAEICYKCHISLNWRGWGEAFNSR